MHVSACVLARRLVGSEAVAEWERQQDPEGKTWDQRGKKNSAWNQLKRSHEEDSVGSNRGSDGGGASWSSSDSSWKRSKWYRDVLMRARLELGTFILLR